MLETKRLNEKTRAAAPGSFVKLSRGTVHYELTGDPAGRTVVLVHGALTPMFIWDALVPELCEAGFRVLRYDNYGRGWSDRPRARYDERLYLSQLLELINALEIEQPVHLVGVSQGGAISVAFTARNPDRVAKMALLAPAGLPRRREVAEHIATLPVLGEAVINLAGPTIILKALHRNLTGTSKLEKMRSLISVQMKYRGFRRTALAMLRDFPMGGLRGDFEKLGRQERDIFLLWGTADKVLPFELSHIARKLLPDAEFHAIDKGGHVVHWEEPERVNPSVLAFLQR